MLVGLVATVLMFTTELLPTKAETFGLLTFLVGVNASIFMGADFSRLAVNASKLRMAPGFDTVTVSAHPAFAEALATGMHAPLPPSVQPGDTAREPF